MTCTPLEPNVTCISIFGQMASQVCVIARNGALRGSRAGLACQAAIQAGSSMGNVSVQWGWGRLAGKGADHSIKGKTDLR